MAECNEITREQLHKCVDSLLPSFGIKYLKEKQFEALYSFISGREVYVSLPTGSGKSVIFHLIPLVHEWMFEQNRGISKRFKQDAIIVIICPLLALMQDQVKILTNCGLKAAYIGGDQSESTLKDIELGLYTYIFLSPESALSNERWRNMLSSKIYQDKLVGIVIDEVHCMTEWGISSSSDKRNVFRKWYSKINEARSLTDVPFMALTATATKTTKERIFELLELKCPVEIIESPNRNNISYCVQSLDKHLSLAEQFRCVIEEIRQKGKNSRRTIIYCQTIKQCSLLYKMFEKELDKSFYLDMNVNPMCRFIEMIHSGTPNSVKEHVMKQFSSEFSHLRILIATIAYGMGVNCQGVTRVIHFVPSKSIQAYIQESGRSGRAGESSIALLLFNGVMLKVADAKMKDYVKSESCRRKLLSQYFDAKLPSKLPTGHECCDVCALNCECQDGYCNIDLHMPCDKEMFSQKSTKSKSVRRTERKLLQKKLLMKAVVSDENNTAITVCYPNVLLEFGKDHIDQILNHADTIFTVDDIMESVDIWKKTHANDVLESVCRY
ncbi:mediator of RNA polymerase II transcription subunit 34-like [Paramuricea clavata]|uniref:DNA 3'-5' helicase n=1 Tax=Paramuricea clavata TaxID=317549 RepID=A0A7D9I2H5_PARCT|nr:mediator of RNA polymerase II transcription subunit 34-like [Paramuricea clavata]